METPQPMQDWVDRFAEEEKRMKERKVESQNKVNHRMNLLIAQGRVHGTVFLEGKPRQTNNEWVNKRRTRRTSIGK